jgi:hypothetical protein
MFIKKVNPFEPVVYLMRPTMELKYEYLSFYKEWIESGDCALFKMVFSEPILLLSQTTRTFCKPNSFGRWEYCEEVLDRFINLFVILQLAILV